MTELPHPMAGYGLGDDGKPAPLMGFHVPTEPKPYDDPADDVRVAISQCATADGDVREAFGRFAGTVREDGIDPVAAIANLDNLDGAAWQNPNVAVGMVDAFARQPHYKPKPVEPENDPWIAAAREAAQQTVSKPDYDRAKPHLKNLEHRNGSATEFIDNVLHMREMARVGGEDHKLARQTAHSHYNKGFSRLNPGEANAVRDIAQVTKVFPDIANDAEMRAAVADELSNGDFPLEFTPLEMAHEARRRVLERQRHG